MHSVLKSQKVAFNIASVASYVYILSGQKSMKNAKNRQFWRLFENLKNSNATFWVILNTVRMSQNYLLAVLNFDAKIWKMQHWCRIFAPKLTNLKNYFVGFWFSRKFKQNLVCNVTKNETFFCEFWTLLNLTWLSIPPIRLFRVPFFFQWNSHCPQNIFGRFVCVLLH